VSFVQVLAPGLFTTVQDLGREGFGPMGVSRSGAADSLSLRLGNRLVANPERSAGLEMTLLGGTFHFPEAAVVALTGSDFGATLDGAPVELWTSIEVRPGQTLRLGPTLSGARCYMSVRGGIVVTPFLGSASTDTLSGLGGLEGRALRPGDLLEIGSATGSYRQRSVVRERWYRASVRHVVRVTPGPQVDWFPEPSLCSFYTSTYRVGEQSNRMGLRLEGEPLSPNYGGQMITEGVSLGAVQVPPEGLPIVLFVEQQTTGGYPKVANVISADLHRIGQLRPRDEIRFEEVRFETARSLLVEQEALLASQELIRE
jgi:antagonist of KipI